MEIEYLDNLEDENFLNKIMQTKRALLEVAPTLYCAIWGDEDED